MFLMSNLFNRYTVAGDRIFWRWWLGEKVQVRDAGWGVSGVGCRVSGFGWQRCRRP